MSWYRWKLWFVAWSCNDAVTIYTGHYVWRRLCSRLMIRTRRWR